MAGTDHATQGLNTEPLVAGTDMRGATVRCGMERPNFAEARRRPTLRATAQRMLGTPTVPECGTLRAA